MKNIKKFDDFITEALGVPSGLLDAADAITDGLIEQVSTVFAKTDGSTPLAFLVFKRLIEVEFSDPEMQVFFRNFLFSGVSFSDLQIQDLIIEVKMICSKDSDKVSFESFAYQLELEPDTTIDNLLVVMSKQTTITLYMSCPQDVTWEQIVLFLQTEQGQLRDSLSHELKHVYDYFKTGKESIAAWANYKSSDAVMSSIEAINKFFDAIYYFSSIESLTRTTEFSMRLRRHGITAESFSAFIRNDKIFKALDYMQKFDSFESFRQAVINDPDLPIVFETIGALGFEDYSLEDKADTLLNSLWHQYKGSKQKVIERIVKAKIKSGFTSVLVGDQEQKKIKDIVKKSFVAKDYREFYTKWLEYFIRKADYLKRKLLRLAVTLPDNRQKTKNSFFRKN